MTPAEMAARLTGCQYRNEIRPEDARLAAAAGLVVLFGASDDLAELRGAIDDEAGCYNGGEIVLVDGKLFREPDCSCEWAEAAKVAALSRGAKIEAVWCEGRGGASRTDRAGAGGALISWTYRTDIPHATFDVMEDGEVYCRGIVFALADAR